MAIHHIATIVVHSTNIVPARARDIVTLQVGRILCAVFCTCGNTPWVCEGVSKTSGKCVLKA